MPSASALSRRPSARVTDIFSSLTVSVERARNLPECKGLLDKTSYFVQMMVYSTTRPDGVLQIEKELKAVSWTPGEKTSCGKLLLDRTDNRYEHTVLVIMVEGKMKKVWGGKPKPTFFAMKQVPLKQFKDLRKFDAAYLLLTVPLEKFASRDDMEFGGKSKLANSNAPGTMITVHLEKWAGAC